MDVNNISLQADEGDDEEDWRQVTSADVVARAINIWDKCGYVWGGFPGTQSQAALGANGKSYLTGAKGTPYATDCSGFVAWCWGFHQRMFSTHDMRFSSRWKFTKKVASTGIIEQDMPGIIPGDALVRNNGSAGHTAIYMGNNTYWDANTSWWAKSPPHGMGKHKGTGTFEGFCPFDGRNVPEYDANKTDIVTDNVSNGQQGEYPNPPFPGQTNDQLPHNDISDNQDLMAAIIRGQYIRRYSLCKHLRRI